MSPIDLQEVKAHLFYSLAVPIPCLLIAIFYLVIAYKFIYNDDKDKHVSYLVRYKYHLSACSVMN